MSEDLQWLSAALDDPSLAPTQGLTGPHARLAKALRDGNDRPADIVSLIRSVLRYEEMTAGCGARVSLSIPKELLSTWGPKELQACSLEVMDEDCRGVQIRCLPWRPAWSLSSTPGEVEGAAMGLQARRPIESCPGDLILKRLDFGEYKSSAQKLAVRAILCAPPGSTLAVSLPTGSGKTLCAFVPALIRPDGDAEGWGVTPIVVPTIALALDLEKRIKDQVGHEVAYRPESSDMAREVRLRCEAGLQGPVVCSPEAFAGSLFGSLLTAARAGYLRYLVVDEAHMILNWGDEFRPTFQGLSACRRTLLSQAPPENKPKTVLMSATLTAYHMHWLRDMFSEGEAFHFIHAGRLRPEPSYWIVETHTEEERTAQILDCLRHLPKPLILYTTTRAAAARWYGMVTQGSGFGRVALITGESETSQRSEAMRDWDKDRIDIMVATSAFGLGVDKGDVRAIIHAELPESIDRFYQDVGRSGRDGQSSLSVLFWHRGDREKLRRLSSPAFIGTELGFQRWQRMFHSSRLNGDGTRTVDLTIGRTLDMESEQNVRWNVRTLMLMQRARLVSIEANEEEPRRDTVRIRTLFQGHTEPTSWEAEISALRTELKAVYTGNIGLLDELLSAPSRCCAELFGACYRVQQYDCNPVRACGGCPYCRQHHQPTYCGRIIGRSTIDKPFPPCRPPGPQLSAWLRKSRRGVLLFRPSELSGPTSVLLRGLLEWLVRQNVVNFVGPAAALKLLLPDPAAVPDRFFFTEEKSFLGASPEAFQHTACLVANPRHSSWMSIWRHFGSDAPMICILVLPDGTEVPDHAGRLVQELVACPVLTTDQWCEGFRA